MGFWLGVLAAGIFAWYAVKMGFYESWATLFNIVVAVYLAVFLRPVITEMVPAAGQRSYGQALTLTVTAVVFFLVLHGITYTAFTGQFSIAFPKILDTLGAGLLGFLGGFLIYSFVMLAVYVTPVSQNAVLQTIAFGSSFEETNVSYVAWWCKLVHRVAGRQEAGHPTGDVLAGLLDAKRQTLQSKQRNSLAKPVEPADANEPEAGSRKVVPLGPPPEFELDDN